MAMNESNATFLLLVSDLSLSFTSEKVPQGASGSLGMMQLIRL
jgi:hypothetical protein